MLASTIILGLICILLICLSAALFYFIIKVGEKRIAEEKEAAKKAAQPRLVPLDEKGVMEAVRAAGYNPEKTENWVQFKVGDSHFAIGIDRFPQVFTEVLYTVSPDDFDIDMLRHAAHLLSDEFFMAKASVEAQNQENGTYIMTICTASIENDAECFKANLQEYIKIISAAENCLFENYNKLKDEKAKVKISLEPYLNPGKQSGTPKN